MKAQCYRDSTPTGSVGSLVGGPVSPWAASRATLRSPPFGLQTTPRPFTIHTSRLLTAQAPWLATKRLKLGISLFCFPAVFFLSLSPSPSLCALKRLASEIGRKACEFEPHLDQRHMQRSNELLPGNHCSREAALTDVLLCFFMDPALSAPLPHGSATGSSAQGLLFQKPPEALLICWQQSSLHSRSSS